MWCRQARSNGAGWTRNRPGPGRLPARVLDAVGVRGAGLDEARLVGENDELHAVPQVELLQDVGHVGLDGGLADVELAADLGVRESAGDQTSVPASTGRGCTVSGRPGPGPPDWDSRWAVPWQAPWPDSRRPAAPGPADGDPRSDPAGEPRARRIRYRQGPGRRCSSGRSARYDGPGPARPDHRARRREPTAGPDRARRGATGSLTSGSSATAQPPPATCRRGLSRGGVRRRRGLRRRHRGPGASPRPS